MSYDRETVLKANIALHSSAADEYNDEPHFKPEYVERVRNIIRVLKESTGGQALLDVGCGTGFIINIAKDYFQRIRGIDVTPAMLEKVDTEHLTCDIKVQIAEAEKLPYKNNSFDVCVSHGVLHHLHMLPPVLKEIFRVLKPGGVFYTDLDPSTFFWEAMNSLPKDNEYCDIIKREIGAVLHNDKDITERFNLDIEIVKAAEHLKYKDHGINADEVSNLLNELGFDSIEVVYEWFLDEAKIIHGEKVEYADFLRSWLREMLPVTRHLFKYVGFRAIKPKK